MWKNRTYGSYRPLGCVAILGLVWIMIVFFRLFNVVKWGWLWVLSPAWLSLGLMLAVACVLLVTRLKNGKKNT